MSARSGSEVLPQLRAVAVSTPHSSSCQHTIEALECIGRDALLMDPMLNASIDICVRCKDCAMWTFSPLPSLTFLIPREPSIDT